MNQKGFNSVKELIKKNGNECLLFELDKLVYLINEGNVYSVYYVNELATEVRLNRNDEAFKVYIDREAEVKKLYKAYRTQVLYWMDFDKKDASRNLVENELRNFFSLIGDDIVKISDVDDFLMEEIDLEAILKSLEENLILF